jgi:hypothetical protein
MPIDNASAWRWSAGGAKRIGRAPVRLALAGDGWDVAVITRDPLGGRRWRDIDYGVRAIEALGRRALGGARCRPGRRGRHACAAGALRAGARPAHLPGQQRRRVRARQRRRLQPRLLARATCDQRRRTGAAGAGAACAAAGRAARRGRQPARPEAVQPEPRLPQLHAVQERAEGGHALLAQALAPRVRVVGIAPGITLPSGEQDRGRRSPPRTWTPLGRSSTRPRTLRSGGLSLFSAPAVTGTTLLVDGGQHLVPSDRDFMFLTEKP